MSEPRRSSTSDISPANGPLPLFEHNIRTLSESVLAFFQERKRIEESYVESLGKLHKKIKSIDAYLDDRTDLATMRVAWSEVRDNIDRDAQTRQAFLSSLTVDVINPLTQLRERIRKRIKDDLKESGSAYNDYAENGLPKLKSKYLKKFAEVEESKRAAAAAPPLSPVAAVTSPQPLRALERRPSGSAPSGRNRSPSSSTAFSDLAHQGKRQLNQLRGLLEKSGTVKEAGRETHALKAVRAKRDADEADKEYRNGVHWLETLRLRRIKTLGERLQGTSLETLVEEMSTTVKKVLEKYTDNMTATSTTQAQLATHARSIVDKISPEIDVSKLASLIPRSLASAIPERILYENAAVGECEDLIFGFSLADYAVSHNLADGEVPKIVAICIKEIDQRGLESEGIYRVSGRHAVVQSLLHEIERDESKFEFKQKDDIFAVASLLKLYLRELPEKLFRFSLQDRMAHTEDLADHQSNNFMLLRSKIRRLPPVHQATLKALLEHLSRVVALCEKNKMDAKNLAIVFGGVIFGEDEIPNGDLLTMQTWKDTLMEDLITHSHIILHDDAINQSPPLPATPAGAVPELVVYGSKRTHVATVPPASPPNRAATASPQDFTPRLPPRPPNSIHPSARANPPPSPIKDRTPIPPRPSNEVPSSPAQSTTTLDTETSLRTSLDLESLSEASQPRSARQSLQTIPPSPNPSVTPLAER
ncbi:hypothetical protein FB45DRAFT_915968 [Roridomyces roridus]|uniref:Rho-GAP domain-containing protein n=1 Tax=Roridomyces roridus TaxID=1738132 RepID=A0AAD7BTQ9_9AGAR|nr:hypothetical protein FB45DRAFT_915968 [Roridomyces roridus]